MGYTTKYDLTTTHREPEDYTAFAKTLSDELGWVLSGDSEEMKWYEHQSDMLKLSAEYPDEIFVLSGVGEEQPDMWRSVYYGGQEFKGTVEIVFAPITVPGLTLKEKRISINR